MNLLQTYRETFKFISAREFWFKDLDSPFNYQRNNIERLGAWIVSPLLNRTDNILKHIKEPYMITALTAASIGITTLIFYPEECFSTATTIFPFLPLIKPWMVKFGVYMGTELIIFGIGLRTLGRFSNGELREAWQNQRIVSIPIGTIIERRNPY